MPSDKHWKGHKTTAPVRRRLKKRLAPQPLRDPDGDGDRRQPRNETRGQAGAAPAVGDCRDSEY